KSSTDFSEQTAHHPQLAPLRCTSTTKPARKRANPPTTNNRPKTMRLTSFLKSLPGVGFPKSCANRAFFFLLLFC
ncbi:hypothetical protein, partial [Caldilinea sp.]|uniref:hypothetical protein n=1 Tax=Caldilinea sp. TaxID=2293560 RepID=UPI002CEA20AB|nr:hypothetical protein [Caldilinea sp.]